MRHIYLAVLLTMSAFSSCEKIDFSTSLQEKSNTDNVKNTETTSENTTVNSDSHVVILREILSEDKVNVMYVSLNEWGNMTSTYSNDAGEGAQNIASAYQEGDSCDPAKFNQFCDGKKRVTCDDENKVAVEECVEANITASDCVWYQQKDMPHSFAECTIACWVGSV